MTPPSLCPHCQEPLPVNAPEGLCPRCLLQSGLSSPSPLIDSPATAGWGAGFAVPAPPELAAHFPHLEILEVLGQGGMGAVYKARQTKLDRLVAVKVLPPEWGQDATFAERFAREARALARLNHPHVVAVHDFGEAGGLFYLVMEYVDGANLRQVLQGGRLAPEQALKIVPQLCEALQYAHEEGIVHRDIKPENILIDRKGRVKVADFGLAKLIDRPRAAFTLTASHQVVGTLDYMAPEQRLRPLEVDHRADIYALGVVFYEMLTGELPLGRFAAPSQIAAVDPRIDEVVFRALAKEPGQRYQRISEVQVDLEAVAAGGRAAPAAAEPLRIAEPWAGEGPISLPVKAMSDWGREYPGILQFDGSTLTIEYESGIFNTTVNEKRISLSEVQSLSLERGWLSTVLILQTTRLSTIGGVPGGKWGRLFLYVSGRDVGTVEQLVERVNRRPAGNRLAAVPARGLADAATQAPDRKLVQSKLWGPAAGLVLTAVFILVQLIVVASDGSFKWSFVPVACMMSFVSIGVLLFGAYKMATLQSRGWALAAIGLAMLPISYHFLLGLPVGIWAFYVLNRPEVRAAFALSRPDHRLPVASPYVPPPPPPPPPPEPPRPDVPSPPPETVPLENPIARKARSFWRSFRTMFFSSPDREKPGPDELS